MSVKTTKTVVFMSGLIGILITLFLYPIQVTVISYIDKQCIIYPAKFTLFWIHSVDGTPWLEQYEQENNHLVLLATKFKNFGAGTPNNGKVIQSRDGYITYQLDISLPEIHWVVSAPIQSTIMIAGEAWSIYKEVPDYTEVNITASRMFWGEQLFKNRCDVN